MWLVTLATTTERIEGSTLSVVVAPSSMRTPNMTVTADRQEAPSREGAEHTPRLVIDVDVARAQYGQIADAFAGAHIHYAVKANPELPLLTALAADGCRI